MYYPPESQKQNQQNRVGFVGAIKNQKYAKLGGIVMGGTLFTALVSKLNPETVLHSPMIHTARATLEQIPTSPQDLFIFTLLGLTIAANIAAVKVFHGNKSSATPESPKTPTKKMKM